MYRWFFLRGIAGIMPVCMLFIGVTLVSAQFIPRGPELAFSTEMDGRSAIHLLSLRHGLSYSLTQVDAPHRNPVWSPDGSMLVYESRQFNGYNLYITYLEQPLYNEQRLTGSISGETGATWQSEPTDTLLFVGSSGVTNRIYSMSVSANPVTYSRITPPQFSAYAPHVSPRTGETLFVSIRNSQYDVFIYDPLSGRERNLTQDAYIDSMPRWSPDGTRFAFQSYRGDSLDIFVAEADGSNLRALTRERGSDHGDHTAP